ncbi:hypothetical protein Tco_1214308 [Tanacetum coccineum]
MHQPWRSFAAIINKCLSGKTTALESLRLSRAQILWGMYHNKNVDYVYLLWEDLVYQVEKKNSKKNNDMYYPRFTKVIVDYFMAKDLLIPRRNKMFWHTARDDPMFTTIRVISKHQDMQIYSVILPQHLTNQAMLESKAYKTYHAYATGEKIPKTKYVKNKVDPESSSKKKSAQASKGKRIKTSTKVAKPVKKKQPSTTSKEKGLNVLSEVSFGSGADEGTGIIPRVPDVPTYNSDDEHISWKSSDEDDDDEVNVSEDDNQNDDDDDNEDDDKVNVSEGDDDQDDDNEQTKSNKDDDDLVHQTMMMTTLFILSWSTFDEKERQDKEDNEEEWSDDEAYDDETHAVNVEGEELDEEQTNGEEEANELYMDVNVNLEGRDTEMIDATQTNIQSTQVTEDTHVIIIAATPEGQQQSYSVSSGFISNMLNPNPDTAVSSIPSIVDTYLANKMNKAVKIAVQLQSDRLRDEAQAEYEHFINTLYENMRKIIKKKVKEQVKEQVSKILPKIEKFVNDQLKAKVLTHLSNQAKTSHKTLYNALVDAYETDKDILETYGDTVTFKRRRDDEDENEEPSAGSKRGSKRRRAEKEPESTSAPKEKTSKSPGKTKEGSKSHYTSTGFTEDQPVDETTQHPDCTLAQNEDPHESFNELMDSPLDFLAFVMNRLKFDTLIPELLVGPAYELMKDWNNPEGQQYPHDLRKPLPLIPNSRGRRVIPFDPFINNDLAYLSGGVLSRTYATSVTKTKAADYGHIKWIEDFIPNSMWSQVPSVYKKHALWGISHWGRKHQQFYRFAVNRESAHDVYSKHIILAVTKLKIVECHNYKHLDWITVRRNDDKLYKVKEGDYNRLRLQDIEDILLLLVQGKLKNLNVEEHLALGVSL